MADIPVVEYRLGWIPKDNKGQVLLVLHDGQKITVEVDSPAEMAAMAAILNESPVMYSTENKSIYTGREPIGGT